MNKRILIVDDSESFRLTVGATLESCGYRQVDFAASGKDGLAKANTERPDLVILDVVLPDIIGFEVCKSIKDFFRDTAKVILITGEVDGVDAGRARHAGADEFMVKTSDDSLLRKVTEILGPGDNSDNPS